MEHEESIFFNEVKKISSDLISKQLIYDKKEILKAVKLGQESVNLYGFYLNERKIELEKLGFTVYHVASFDIKSSYINVKWH